MSVKENVVEGTLVAEVKRHGGVAYKFSSPARRNVPDRLVDLPGVPLFFVECKRPGEKPRKAQEREHARLRSRGKTVWVIDAVDQAKTLVASVVHTGDPSIWETPF
ncbi:VRR-NUC domain-containing protein [Dongia sp.]|uniref:VRR-NUC domain-containing protein n=1 Tax=Dongia sp. TaxID=1977262 RepID=UPI0035B4D806